MPQGANATSLAEPLLGFIVSRQRPGHLLIEALDRVPQRAHEGRVLLGRLCPDGPADDLVGEGFETALAKT